TPCVKPELTIHQPTAPSAAPAPKIVHNRVRRSGGMAPRQRKYRNGSRNTAPVSRAIRRCDHSHQKIVLKAFKLMPRLSSRYWGIAWYFVNSLCQSLCDSGGSTPVTGFHSTIERPDSVSRVAPPTMSVAKIMAAAQTSHSRTARSRSWDILNGSAIGPLAGDGADHIVLRAASQMTARKLSHVYPHPQADRHGRPSCAGDHLGSARDGARPVGADRHQWLRGGDLLRCRCIRLGSPRHAADQLDGATRQRLKHCKISGSADATEPVPERGAGTRHEHLEISLLLEFAVGRDARQRGQIVAVRLEQHAGPGCDRGFEAELGGNAELARTGGCHVTDRIGQMLRPFSERGLQHGPAHFHFGAHRGIARYFLEHQMIDRMRADRAERIGGKFKNLGPAHAEIAAERENVDAVACAKVAHGAAQLFFGLHLAQMAIDRIVEFALLLRTRTFEILILAVDDHADTGVLGNDGLECDPPKFAEPVGKTCRDVHRERQPVFAQQRIGPAQEILVTVVKRKTHEAANFG